MKFGCAFLFLSLCFCSSLVSCASGPATVHRQLVPVWREYTALPGKRALAIAGVPGRGPWVTAASGGHVAAINSTHIGMIVPGVGQDLAWNATGVEPG